ncbi:MAG: beta-N-acetylhexosaminidase [Vicinamibacterales bacterium]
MNTARSLGRFVMIGFDGVTVPPEVRSLAREFDIGGYILFSRNVVAPAQVAELVHDLRQISRDRTPWIGVDQEGGRVARLRSPFTEWPPMAVLGRSADEALARRFGSALARELAAVGISIDFAPVLDVNTNPTNPVIGDRSLGDSPDTVARLGAAVLRELQALGVAACGKHFPGHGDTSVDSHLDLPLVEHPPERLAAVEYVPFRAAIEAGVASVMVGHLLVPALDEDLPAPLSKATVGGELRGKFGFDGLVVTDDLCMKGCATRYTVEKATVAAVAAGCDLVLICEPDHDRQAAALEALVRAVESGEIGFGTIDDGLVRHRMAAERFMAAPVFPLNPAWRPPSEAALRTVVGCEEHLAVAEAIAAWR